MTEAAVRESPEAKGLTRSSGLAEDWPMSGEYGKMDLGDDDAADNCKCRLCFGAGVAAEQLILRGGDDQMA